MSPADTLHTANAASGDGNSNVPLPPPSFSRTWNRLFSALKPLRHDTGEDRVERGEHRTHAQGITNGGENNHENAEAGAASMDGTEKATKGQQHSQFSSSAFDRLPQPVPVVDVFFGSWWPVLALRTATRPVVFFYSIYWIWSSILYGVFWILFGAMFISRWLLLRTGHDTVPLLGSPIPGKRQLFWVLFRWIQKFWVFPRQFFSEDTGTANVHQ